MVDLLLHMTRSGLLGDYFHQQAARNKGTLVSCNEGKQKAKLFESCDLLSNGVLLKSSHENFYIKLLYILKMQTFSISLDIGFALVMQSGQQHTTFNVTKV